LGGTRVVSIDAVGAKTKVRAVADEDKGKKAKDDEDEREEERSEAGDDADEAEEKSASKQAESDESAEGDGEGDEAAERVAEALGVGKEEKAEGEEAPAEEEEAAAPNRAERRRKEAMERRRKRKPGAKAATADAAEATDTEAEEELPKDKNARAKALLKKRREQAASPTRKIDLLPGEMVDDAVARSTSAATKWLRDNFSSIQWVILAGLVGGGAFLGYNYFTEKKSGDASDAFDRAVLIEKGRVATEDKRTDEEKEFDPSAVFKTVDEQNENALASYRETASKQSGAIAVLAKLGEAGILLDKRDWQGALSAYAGVVDSPLAVADPDVKGRAIEGLGLAKEGKGDLDGAMASFKEMQGIDIKGYKELGQMHEARILVAKGDKDKAKEILKKAHETLKAPSTDTSNLTYIEGMVDDALRDLDPTAVPAKSAFGGPRGGAMTPEEIENWKRRLQEAAKKKEDKH
jgi:hypothetical protein